ncbi:hypothetical protein J4E85_001904 [Alternaria conjuncta]|uniref:uncharacterized protein n=1 Tax=Alternaria conjuncta TaxID=181017 RepID=UPI0022207A01|nr:uncharacterized protein J4E85_001904 [Alternaria conjuncta]KAI4936574.1 hypothetical protein J4E85_001904 [Alternaria conjuncta]
MGLAEALPHFPDLVSLDLSKTAAARDKAVLSTFKYLRNLRVLNLRGIGIRDEEFSVVAHAISSRVRSLDISNNLLTDTSVRLLLELCLKERVVVTHSSRGPLAPVENANPTDGPETFESENLVGHLRKKLTGGFIGSLSIEESSDVGVSHLYLSSNAITVEEYASSRLRYLRINYELVTEDAPLETPNSPRAELTGDLAIYKPPNAHELEAVEPPTPELDSIPLAVHEVSGDSSYPVELPGSPVTPQLAENDRPESEFPDGERRDAKNVPKICVTPQSLQINRDPACAPEVIPVDSPLSPLSPLGNGIYQPHAAANRQDPGERLSSSTPTHGSSALDQPTPKTTTRSRGNSFYYIEDRKVRLDFRQASEPRLNPGMLPKLHTLVLTDVPTMTSDRKIVHRIIQFIKDAAEEASIAKQRARHTYVLPPGRRRAIAEEEYARNQFALRRVVLEMAAPQSAPKKISTSWRAYPTKSTTEDADSEAFWEAATHDFSFFDDEECGQPGREPGRSLPLAAMSGLELAPSNPVSPVDPSKDVHDAIPLIDVVGEIGKFRRERKAAYNNLVEMGKAEPDVEGYWPGDITVLRKPANSEAGELDCYGNRYELGWFYR